MFTIVDVGIWDLLSQQKILLGMCPGGQMNETMSPKQVIIKQCNRALMTVLENANGNIGDKLTLK